MHKPKFISEIKDLLQEDKEGEGHLYHWYLEFSVRMPELTDEEREALDIKTEEGEEKTSYPWAVDEITIQAGPDSMEAIKWLIEYVNNEEEYGMPVTGFRLTGITLLSIADVTL